MPLRSMPVLWMIALFAFALLLAGCGSRPAAPLSGSPATGISDTTSPPLSAAQPHRTAQALPQTTRTIYLAEGGASHLVLEETAPGVFTAEGTLHSYSPQTTFTAEIRQTTETPWLIVQSEKPYPYYPDDNRLGFIFVSVPDAARAHDWSIHHWDFEMGRDQNPEPIRFEIPEPLPQEPSGPFLHRVDDVRVPFYFRMATEADFPSGEIDETAKAAASAELLRLAQEMTAAHPDDLYFRVLLLDALLRNKQFGRLVAELDRGEAEAARSYDPEVYKMFREARYQVQARQLDAAGRNAVHLLDRIFYGGLTVPRAFPLLADISRYDSALTTVSTIIRPGLSGNNMGWINWVPVHVSMKAARVYADLYLIQGRRAEARAIAVGYYRIAQLYQHDYRGGNIQALFGMAFRSNMASTLQLQAANAVQTPAEATALWKDLEMLNLHERPVEERPRIPADMIRKRSPSVPSADVEFHIREKAASTGLQLARLTLAARHYQMTTGYLPTSIDQLRPMYPAGLPVDPFTSRPLLLAPARTEITLYSTGPDMSNDRGAVVYDPTNGTISAGDIAVRVPIEREYPFHPQGTNAGTAADVKRQFPRGLPPDPFADTRDRGYTISETPGPVHVFSFGPDTDQSRLYNYLSDTPKSGTAVTPDVPYDPTNGATSRGDIFIQLPGG